MAQERRTVQSPWRHVIGIALFVGCGSGDDDDSTPASLARDLTVDELEAALLTPDEVGSGWRSEGAEALEIAATEEMGGRCPAGSSFTRHTAGVFVDFEPPDEFADNTISQVLLTFETRENLDAWTQALVSCVGEQWEEGGDPVEHVRLQTVDVDDHGDDSAGFMFHFAHGEDEPPAHVSRWFVVRVDDVLMLVSGEDYELDDPEDEALLAEAVGRAVDKVEATLSS